MFFYSQIKAQDQIIYLNGDKYYVDKIIGIQNDSLIYSYFKKTRKIPLTRVKGYYVTIDTKENLKKGFYKREREYHKIDTVYHVSYYNRLKEKDPDVEFYIQSCIKVDFSTLDYYKGFYITQGFDTIISMISKFEDPNNNCVVFIVKNDSSNYKIFTPRQVRGYSFNNQFYLSYFPAKKDEQEIYMFILQEISGKINLYTKPNLPYHEGEYYLVNKNGSEDFYYVCPYDICMNYNARSYNRVLVSSGKLNETSYAYVSTKPDLDNSFKDIMPQLVYDCEGLVNKIRSEFYTKNDIKNIINQYNSGCK